MSAAIEIAGKCLYCKTPLSLPSEDNLKNYLHILFCPHCQKGLIARSRKPTKQEIVLFKALLDKGITSELHTDDGHKIIDIVVEDARVHIEVDGIHHNGKADQALSDLKRTYHSLRSGYITLRIPNSLIDTNVNEAVEFIEKYLNVRRIQLQQDRRA